MLVLFTGISSFQSIHEWVHHHSEDAHHSEESCEWFAVKALPFVQPSSIQVVFHSVVQVVVHDTPYACAPSHRVVYYFDNRGPPVAEVIVSPIV